jgi:hypothetical protein
LPLPGNELRFLCHRAHNLVAVPTQQFWPPTSIELYYYSYYWSALWLTGIWQNEDEMDRKWLEICCVPATTKEYCGEIPRKITNNHSQRSRNWDSKKESSKLKPGNQLTLPHIEELTPEYATD